MRFGRGYAAWTGGSGGGASGRGCGPRGSRSWGPFTVEWSMDGERGGPRGRRRMFDGGELRLVLLKLVEDQPRHGYDLIRAIEERTGGAYAPSPGVVYPTLTMLEDMGHIEEQKAEGARKLFAITEAGRTHLTEKAEEVAELIARLEALGQQSRASDASPVRRAIRNLRMVLQGRLNREDMTADTTHEIAELIDDLARRIERL